MTSLPGRMAETIRKYNMLKEGDRVLAAFSGGADSLALLCALLAIKEEWGLELAAAHLDHGLRGERSRADADWAEEFCRGRNITFFRGYWPGHAYVNEGRSPEEAARRARRSFLEEALKEWHGGVIALGHHLDDQAETVLIHLLRGAGLRGLGGIRPVNGMYIRPLLEISRRSIMEYTGELGVEPRYDETNGDTAYLRNRLRLQVVPLLKGINPDFAAAAGRTAELAGEEDAYLDGLAGKALAGLDMAGPALSGQCPERDRIGILYRLAGKVRPPGISLGGLSAMDPVLARRTLRLWIAAETGVAGVDMAGLERIWRLALSGRIGARTEISGGVSVIREKGYLALISGGGERSGREDRGAAPMGQCGRRQPIGAGESIRLSGGARISARWAASVETEPGREEGSFQRAPVIPGGEEGDDAAFIERYLCLCPSEGPWPELRRRQPGDWLQMPYGRKKLKELYNEKGVPRDLRDSLPLLARDGQVLWIPGVAKALCPGQSGAEKHLEFTCLLS